MILPTADGKSKLRFIGLERYGSSEISPLLLDKVWTTGLCKGEPPSHLRIGASFAPGMIIDPGYIPYEYYWLQIRGLQSASAPTNLIFPEEYHHHLGPGQVLVHTKSACFRKSHSRDGRPSLWHIEDVESDIQRENGGLWGGELVSGRDFGMKYSCETSEELEYVEAIALSINNGSLDCFENIKVRTPAEVAISTGGRLFGHMIGDFGKSTDLESGNFESLLDLGSETGNLADFEIGNYFPGWDHHDGWRVDVMLIRRVGGVAYRTGLGWVSLEKWIEVKPTFKTIVLG